MKYEKQPDCMKPACGVSGKVCVDCAGAAWKKQQVQVKELDGELKPGETLDDAVKRTVREAEREEALRQDAQQKMKEEYDRMMALQKRAMSGVAITPIEGAELALFVLIQQFQEMGQQIRVLSDTLQAIKEDETRASLVLSKMLAQEPTA